jgi:hypothetical protein
MKKFFYLIIILLVVGMWLGMNFANNQPFFSNPFADKEVAGRAKETAKAVQRKAEEAVERVMDDTVKD